MHEQKTNIDYESAWEAEVLVLATKSATTSWILSALIIPFFAFFEFSVNHDRFLEFLYIFLCVSGLMFVTVLIKKYLYLPPFIATYGVSIIVSLCFSYMAVNTDAENVHNYLMAVSTITLVRGLMYFGKTENLVVVTLLNHSIAYGLVFMTRCENLLELPAINGTLFFGLIFILFSFVGANSRYKITKESFINSLKLKTSLDIIEEKNKEILDSITYARRIQHALLTNENYITKTLNRLWPKK
jgi:hypothetical protein